MEPGIGVHGTAPKRLSRENTIEEKRKMRRQARKRRLKSRGSKVQSVKSLALEKELESQSALRRESELKVNLYKRISRSFWERWQWELQQRRQSMIREKMAIRMPVRGAHNASDVEAQFQVEDVFVGRGCFAVVKLQLFRGIEVAVKELLPRTVLADVLHEASILLQLSHPYVPYLFGICTRQQPYKIVMQFEGIASGHNALTLHGAIVDKKVTGETAWLTLCAELMEALRYLHDEVSILHNDLKTNNILISEKRVLSMHDSTSDELEVPVQIVLIDFGKATRVDEGKRYHLSWTEQTEHTRRYPHLAPELIEGMTKQTRKTDIYSAGGVVQRIVDADCFTQLSVSKQQVIAKLATDCCSPNFYSRPTAQRALKILEELMD